LDDFIKQTLELLKKSDIHLEFPETRDVALRPDGILEINLQCPLVSAEAEIRTNTVLVIMIFFTLIDSLVDKMNLDKSEKFQQRYEALDDSTDYRIIFKETYGIMKLARNAVVHQKCSVFQDNNEIRIDYCRKRKHFKLTITARAMRLIFSLILFYSRMQENSYVTAILRTYYDDVVRGISSFSDGNRELRKSIAGLRLKRGVRYRLRNADWDVRNNEDSLIISRCDSLTASESWSGVDYIVTLGDISYLVPDEALNHSGEISMSSLDDWKCETEPFFFF
jgi:hypothetical protein